jgi:hypothetical protein
LLQGKWRRRPGLFHPVPLQHHCRNRKETAMVVDIYTPLPYMPAVSHPSSVMAGTERSAVHGERWHGFH